MVGYPEIAALAVLLLVLAAEWLHGRRIRTIAGLLFGAGRPIPWSVRIAPAIRALAAAALAWGLTLLLLLPAKIRASSEEIDPKNQRHVIFVLDVSPSMRIADAGSGHGLRRSERVAAVLQQFFRMAPPGQARFTVLATYTSAKPVVLDTRDPEVVLNIADRLPLAHVFESGRTQLFSGIAEAAQLARIWPPASTSVIVLSDGDSVPATGMPRLPASVNQTVVVGFGNPDRGTFINGRNSRQDVASLRQIAARLGGVYVNGDLQGIPPALVDQVAGIPEKSPLAHLGRREGALTAILAGSLALALLPEWLSATVAWPARRRFSLPVKPISQPASLPQ